MRLTPTLLLLGVLALGSAILGPRPGPISAASVAAVAAGGYHTCALTEAGGVQCWGDNASGQLGDGTTTDRATPVDVVGLGSGLAAIAAGRYHTCALTKAGGVKCWGRNFEGKLGDGTNTLSLTPVEVTGLATGVATIAAGNYHTCALATIGELKCWGWNAAGQLGDGTTTDSSTPVEVTGLTTGVAAVAAGEGHTCALTTAGGVQCWGSNWAGQLGNGTTTSSAFPVDVTGLASGVAALAVGTHHACAVTIVGGVQCWGHGFTGQLGNGTFGPGNFSPIPVEVVGLSGGVATVAGGGSHSCALTTADGLKCWGRNDVGQVGDGTSGFANRIRPTPVDVVGLSSGVAALTAGIKHTCALTTAANLKCWGQNRDGQLGDGGSDLCTTLDPPELCSPLPVDVAGLGPKATPTPPSVGGIAELPEVAGMPLEATGSSSAGGSLFASVAGAVVTGTLALGGAAWYARRCWLR